VQQDDPQDPADPREGTPAPTPEPPALPEDPLDETEGVPAPTPEPQALPAFHAGPVDASTLAGATTGSLSLVVSDRNHLQRLAWTRSRLM
jgi:hypothetical protein